MNKKQSDVDALLADIACIKKIDKAMDSISSKNTYNSKIYLGRIRRTLKIFSFIHWWKYAEMRVLAIAGDFIKVKISSGLIAWYKIADVELITEVIEVE